jgi:hypothetical protein
VSGANIQITAQPVSGNGAITTYTIAGIVPEAARTALVGARINSECYSCNGPTDLTIYGFQYNENTQRKPVTWDFAKGVSGWLYGPGAAVFDSGEPPYVHGLHVTAKPGQPLMINSTAVAVTPKAQFTLRVTARVSPISVGSGYFTLIWLNAAGNEPLRETLLFQPQTQSLGGATTAKDGSFTIANSLSSDDYAITAEFAGSATLWPAISPHYGLQYLRRQRAGSQRK